MKAAAEALWRARPRVNLVIVAHADDAEVCFGASMLHLIGRGEKVFIIVASDGRLSCAIPDSIRGVVRRRKSEQLEAARLAGVSGVFFLGLPDGELQSLKARLKERIVYYIRRLKPSSLFSHDPTPFYYPREADDFRRSLGAINHPDHRAVGEAALDAIRCGSTLRRCFPKHARQGLSPWDIDEIFLASPAHPNVAVKIGPYVNRKKALMSVFLSQKSRLWLDGAVASEKGFRHIPCSPQSFELGLHRAKPAAKRRFNFFIPLKTGAPMPG